MPDLLRLTSQATEPRVRTLETAHGPILLRDWCPPSLVERLHSDQGLSAFARRADREQALLKRIASFPESELVAHTPEGLLIEQVSICAAPQAEAAAPAPPLDPLPTPKPSSS